MYLHFYWKEQLFETNPVLCLSNLKVLINNKEIIATWFDGKKNNLEGIRKGINT